MHLPPLRCYLDIYAVSALPYLFGKFSDILVFSYLKIHKKIVLHKHVIIAKNQPTTSSLKTLVEIIDRLN